MVRLAEILPDLFSIEVNTVIKDQMTAQKMPSVPHALHDIIRVYGRKLESYGVDLAVFFDEAKIQKAEERDEKTRKKDSLERGKPDLKDIFCETSLRPSESPKRFSFVRVKNGWITFEVLRLIAAHLQTNQGPWPRAEPLMLERIRRNCDQLTYILRTLELHPEPRVSWWRRILRRPPKGIATWTEVINKSRGELLHDDLRTKRLPLGDIGTEDLSRIRKIWEIGTERVVTQTTIQVDGDVITRLSNTLYEDRFAERRDSILEAHRQSVDVSLTHWHGLVKIAVEIIGSAVKGLTGLSGKG